MQDRPNGVVNERRNTAAARGTIVQRTVPALGMDHHYYQGSTAGGAPCNLMPHASGFCALPRPMLAMARLSTPPQAMHSNTTDLTPRCKSLQLHAVHHYGLG